MPQQRTHPAAAPASASSRAEFTAMWLRQLPWWHAAFALIWGLALTLLVTASPPRPAAGWQLAGLVALAVGYAAFAFGPGTHHLAFRSPRWGWAYAALAWTVVLGTYALDPTPTVWVLCFVLFPQMWAMLPRLGAASLSVAGVVGMGALQWRGRSGEPDALADILIGGGISLAMSLGLGLFITSMVGEAERRAETIDELRRAQEQLAAAEREQGVVAERERMSREIHDTLAQGFTSVLTLARAVDAALARGDVTTARERLGLVERTAAENLSEARLIVAELTPGHLQSRTLVEALERLVDTVCRESPLRAGLEVLGAPVALGASTEVALLRTAQEALTNVRRHAGAREVSVSIRYDDPTRVVLVVRDDGCGFDVPAITGGFGLDGIRSRTAQLDGQMMIASEPGVGTTVTVEVPR